jgi:hypothetical protein
MSVRSWELVTADESTVVAKSVLNPIMVEDLECDGCFPDSTCTNKSDRLEVFSETDDRFDKFVATETDPIWRRR